MQGNVNIPDSTITTNLSFRQLVLMNMQQLTNFPYIEKDFDALTDYELLSLVVKFLNDVIANQNEQNDSITRMYESFLALQEYVNNTKDTLEDAFNELDDYVRNYFDNLDVQDEINNKLDEMLEDGVLEQIIEQFLQSTAIWCFNTVADMKAATNLIDGSDARTLGYYSINDGGGSLYHITNASSLTEHQEVLNSGLYANLITNGYIKPEQFGAYGDNTNDDTLAVQKAINYCENKNLYVLLTKYYKVSTLNIPFDGLKISGIGRKSGFTKSTNDNLFVTNKNAVFYFTFNDFRINGDNTNGSVFYSTTSNRLSSFNITNVTIINSEKAFYLEDSYVSNINKCLIDTCTNAIEIKSCNALNITECSINNCSKGLYLPTNSTCINFENNTVQSCVNAVLVYAVENLQIRGNYFEYNENTEFAIIHIDGTSSVNVRSIVIMSNRFAPQGTQATTLPIKLMRVNLGFVMSNVFSNTYSKWLLIDSNSTGVTYDYTIQSKYDIQSLYCNGLITGYIEGVATNSATTKGTMAWDRYRDRPIWWDGSKWIYADGTART